MVVDEVSDSAGKAAIVEETQEAKSPVKIILPRRVKGPYRRNEVYSGLKDHVDLKEIFDL